MSNDALEDIKEELKTKGWSYRRAGKAIGKSYQWINLVLNGHEKSAPVLKLLHSLPDLKASTAAKDTHARN